MKEIFETIYQKTTKKFVAYNLDLFWYAKWTPSTSITEE